MLAPMMAARKFPTPDPMPLGRMPVPRPPVLVSLVKFPVSYTLATVTL